MEKEKCKICNGIGVYTKLVVFCDKCSSRIEEFKLNTPVTGEYYDSIVSAVCQNSECKNIIHGELNSIEFEERTVRCDCIKETDERNRIERAYLDGRVPEINRFGSLKFPEGFTKKNGSSIGKLRDAVEEISSLKEQETHSDHNYWIYGGYNSGISSIAVILGTAFIKTGKRVLFIKFQKLVDKINDYSNRDSFLHSLKEYPVLIIDDIFTTGRFILSSDYSKAMLYSFFKEEFESRRRFFIFTSHDRINSIEERDFGAFKHLFLHKCSQIEIIGTI